MSKGSSRRGNKETKKPKQAKKVAVAPAGGFAKSIAPSPGLDAKQKH
jgi:hypothetical protein